MAEKDANRKHYFSLVDEEDTLGICEFLAREKKTLFLWLKGDSEKDVEEFEIQSFDPASKKMTLKSKAGLLKLLTGSRLVGKDVFIKMSTSRFHVFSTSLLTFDDDSKIYTLHINRDVYKGQQRTNYRLMASPYIKVQFKVDETAYPALDISAGGTSFIVNKDISHLFVKDEIKENNVIALNGRKFNIPKARIAGQWDYEDPNEPEVAKVKVGVAFVDLNKGDEEELFKHINSEARGEEIRKKMEADKRKKKA